MANEDHIERLGQGVEAWNAWRTEEPLIRPDLSGADLRDTNLAGADLHGVCFAEANLSGVLIANANLREASLYKANLHEANLVTSDLSGADLAEAFLYGTDLSGVLFINADLRNAVLRKADLYEANLDRANLERANLTEANLTRANLRGANFSKADLKLANLIDAQLDRADLTGAKLWEAQRSGWSIKGITCRCAFWDKGGEEPTEYGEGEFERIFAERPRIVLRYPGGMSSVDLLALPLIVERLQAEHPGSALHVRSMQDDAGGASVTIVVEDLASRGAEAFGQELVRLRTKLECIIEERDHLRQRLGAIFAEGISKAAEFLALPRQEIHVHRPSGLTAIEGPTMSRDTYNIPGQAGAVGPRAHAHNNTFQQAQGAINLPKLAEELGHLREAMKVNATGTREQDKAIGAVADAEEAAAKGDGQAALQYLKSTGKWTLGIAEKIGVAVAVEALKKAL